MRYTPACPVRPEEVQQGPTLLLPERMELNREDLFLLQTCRQIHIESRVFLKEFTAIHLRQEWACEIGLRYFTAALTRRGHALGGIQELYLAEDASFPFLNLWLIRRIVGTTAVPIPFWSPWRRSPPKELCDVFPSLHRIVFYTERVLDEEYESLLRIIFDKPDLQIHCVQP